LSTLQQKTFALLQQSSGVACDSASQILQLTQRLGELSERLQRPNAIEAMHAIAQEVLETSVSMCSLNLALAQHLDSHAEAAVALLRS
jgi:hypothetical protein